MSGVHLAWRMACTIADQAGVSWTPSLLETTMRYTHWVGQYALQPSANCTAAAASPVGSLTADKGNEVRRAKIATAPALELLNNHPRCCSIEMECWGNTILKCKCLHSGDLRRTPWRVLRSENAVIVFPNLCAMEDTWHGTIASA